MATAGVQPCPRHGCVLCPFTLQAMHGVGCGACLTRHLRLLEAEGPVSDPWCLRHGIPTPATWRTCELCDIERRAARHRGWQGRPTWHEGPDCAHCEVCGLCKASGRVCRVCLRCDEHPLDSTDPLQWADCQAFDEVWDHKLREVVFVTAHVAETFDPAAGRWAA